MYESNYNEWTGVLTVRGDSYDIDQALDIGGMAQARKLYRAGTITSGWSTIDNSANDNSANPPIRVTITYNRNGHRMTIRPTIKSFLEGKKRTAEISRNLESEVDSAIRASSAQQALIRS